MKFKNLLIRFFIALAKPFVPVHSGNSFLIVSTTGLGDTLWGTPAIRALRESHPQAYIGVVTSQIGREVLQNNPHIDELFIVNEPPLLSLLKIFPALKKRKIGTVLVFHASQRPLLPFCALLGARQIIGTEKINKDLDFLFTDPLESKKIHEIERRLDIVRAAGANPSSRSIQFFLSAGDHEKAASLLPSDLVIGLHPGAKDRFKQWEPSHFITLGRKLQEKLGCSIVVTGTPAEKTLIDTITESIPGSLGIYEGVSISALAAVVSRLSLYITNDTGPLHIACAMQTPTIALFTPTDPALCGPYFAPHIAVIQKKPTCFPCLKKKCHDPFCMLQISPEEVFEKAISLLAAEKEETVTLIGSPI